MTARDSYPILNDLAMGRFGANASREIGAALDEIDRLRQRDGAYDHVVQMLHDALADSERLAAANEALIARRDDIMRTSGELARENAALRRGSAS